jgi:hypothetical protein
LNRNKTTEKNTWPIYVLYQRSQGPKVKYRVRSPKFIRALVYSCTYWLRPRNSPPPRIWAHKRGRLLVNHGSQSSVALRNLNAVSHTLPLSSGGGGRGGGGGGGSAEYSAPQLSTLRAYGESLRECVVHCSKSSMKWGFTVYKLRK